MSEPTLDEKMCVMLKHGSMLCKYKGEKQGMKEIRKNVAWYVKGLPNSAKIRGNSGMLNTYADLENLADEILGK